MAFEWYDQDLPMSDDDTNWNTTNNELAENEIPACGTTECQNRAPVLNRVIVHIDLDCYYAQVEMLRNPSLRSLPLGIQQKYIIVTCNYVARNCGVTKLMLVTEAKEKCPQLVLVNGEDLSHYRDMSYKVTALLESFCPLVERLGFDENFVDITELVEKRLKQEPSSADLSVTGHIYNQQVLDSRRPEHVRLAEGSRVAAELRAALHTQLGLTGCAGVASSKLLAKLVSGTFKPNQQTTLLPESSARLMDSLGNVHALPGVGYRTHQRLQALGITTLPDLQGVPLQALERELGVAAARRIHSLSLGIDPTPVVPSGPPQSLSDEDSFKKVSTEVEVLKKVKELLSSLLDRIRKDGRVPRTLRLTIRRFSTTNKWAGRESRQCPVPGVLGQKIRSGNGDAVAPLLTLSMKLFHRLVDTHAPFHITLINVCFSNLQSCCPATRGSIESFFSQGSAFVSQGAAHEPVDDFSSPRPRETFLDTRDGYRGSMPSPPPGVDPSVFQELPEHIQRELTSGAAPALNPASPRAIRGLALGPGPEASYSTCLAASEPPSLSENRDSHQFGGLCPLLSSPLSNVPPHVDPQVFKELPAELQAELLSEWKREAPPSQALSLATPTRGRASGRLKPATLSSAHVNSLLKYFRPR